jgi:hypothetical protein
MSEDARLEWPIAFGRGYVVMLVGSLALMALAVGAVWIDPEARAVAGWLTLATVGSLLAILATTYPTRYTLTPSVLEVRAGLFRFRVPWAEIESLDLRTSYLSSITAGWTFQRVGIVRRKGLPLEVGPADRLGFVIEVLARSPQLQPDPKDPKRSWVAARRG